MQHEAPWTLYKTIQAGNFDPETNAQTRSRIDSVVYNCAEATRIVGILLQPYMPAKAAQLLDMLGVDESRRTFDYARLRADYGYGIPQLPVGRDAWDGLFPPLLVDT